MDDQQRAAHPTKAEITMAHGTAFFEAALRCWQPERGSKDGDLLIVQGAVNLAFAGELLLKGLHFLHHGHKFTLPPKKGRADKTKLSAHDLALLFQALPEDVRAEITHDADHQLKEYKLTLAEELDSIGRAFEGWRYMNEVSGEDQLQLHVRVLYYFVQAIYLHSVRRAGLYHRRPDWDDRFRREIPYGLSTISVTMDGEVRIDWVLSLIRAPVSTQLFGPLGAALIEHGPAESVVRRDSK